MKFINKFFLIIFLVFLSCKSTNKISNQDFIKIQGNWINKDDNNWKLTFNGNKFTDTYGIETSEVCKFTISNESCNKEYTTEKATFLKCLFSNEICFEITSLTEKTLTYRETFTGKLHIFKRE